MTPYLNNPFFWALISMFALVGACSVVGSRKIGSHPALGWMIVSIISLGRIILVLPFVEQPRFFITGFNSIIGIPIFLIGIFFGLAPCFLIRPLNVAEKDMAFIATSFYKYTTKSHLSGGNTLVLGLVDNQWFHNWCCTGARMVGRIFIFDSHRGRKLETCTWNEVLRLYEKGERANHSRFANINYLLNIFGLSSN